MGHVVRFLDPMSAHAHEANLCLREFSKSLTNRAYIWYVITRKGSRLRIPRRIVQHKVLRAEAKFSLADSVINLYMKRFHERALDCCVLGTKKFL